MATVEGFAAGGVPVRHTARSLSHQGSSIEMPVLTAVNAVLENMVSCERCRGCRSQKLSSKRGMGLHF